MKKQCICFSVALFLMAGGVLYAQNTVSLDEAVKAGAAEIENRLTRGVKVVVLNFNSPSQRLSNHVLDEMMTELIRNGKVIVVNRADLELIQREMNFQMSGDVSDSSAQSIGQILGAQSIISGSIEDLGAHYRMRFRAIEVETAVIQAQPSSNVRKDSQIAALMGSAGFTTGTTLYPNGLNYPTGYKIGMGFLNWLYGAGSFAMGDWVGGLTVGLIQLGGTILAIYGINDLDYGGEGGAILAGLAVQLGGAVYGHIRPFQYDKRLAIKNGTYYAFDSSNPMRNISLVPVPASDKSIGLGLFYSASY
jgi:TolB-like protein